MKKLIYILAIVILAGFRLEAQHGLSMYHLKNATIQNTQFNAAYVPEFGNFFLGLPVISGINVHASSKLSYNEIFTPSGDSTIVDVSKAISKLTAQNGIYTHLNINLLHLGYRLPSGGVVTFFANERVELDFLFPKKVTQFLWEGNATILEEEVKLGRFALSANHFREIGLGYAQDLPDFGIKVGFRAKYLQGMFNGSLPGNAKGDILTENENYQLNLDLQNGMFRTSGIDIASGDEGDIGSHLVNNGNTGFGVDLGMEYTYNRFYKVAIGINDIGFINWKENITNYSLNDTTFRYTGSQLKGAYSLQDSVENFVDRFKVNDDNTDPYTTMLPARIFGSLIWKYSPRIEVISTISSRVIQGQPRFSFGVGGRYSLGSGLTASANVTKLDQQFFNLGLAVAAKISILQVYIATDHLVGYSAPDLDAIDFRFGINFVFSSKNKSSKDSGPGGRSSYKDSKQSKSKTKGEKGVKYGFFLGEGVKVKGSEDIYTIIKKQKRRKLEKKKSDKPAFESDVETFPTSPKPEFNTEQEFIPPSPKPKFKKKERLNVVSPKPQFKKKKTKNSGSARPKFKKKKRKR